MAKRTVYERPPMRFNTALQNYEVDLPARKKKDTTDYRKDNTIFLITMVVLILLLILIFIWFH